MRLVFDHQAEHPSQWAAINSIAGKIGCTAETLRSWAQGSGYRTSGGFTLSAIASLGRALKPKHRRATSLLAACSADE